MFIIGEMSITLSDAIQTKGPLQLLLDPPKASLITVIARGSFREIVWYKDGIPLFKNQTDVYYANFGQTLQILNGSVNLLDAYHDLIGTYTAVLYGTTVFSNLTIYDAVEPISVWIPGNKLVPLLNAWQSILSTFTFI